ncbi:NADPH-dependent 2,4-dienoyl-CoA reductase/sulfur reductase-like enzyme [Dongia mobilis]|uniref:NADPH-dependent 2,4-dienoyl-CoA reductase/sulfur reductase-like enzyme n=1 Tax=Dongia mobilis TaxID=578943 RepID=A0A4R6WL38_9PROT|nr:FAD/NAD(P)-binding oxidoreductase [Dongia mobilis]TDQ81422.1 NADPH-dependent 2,4-dienoyl-CoA reductase/sulfur reductase-like enzyme [Dongia mobilis]
MAETSACDVAIIGGGPSGLAAAMALREAGVAQVVVLEREKQAGGIPRHCGHPPFGLREFGRILSGPRYAARLVETAERAGIDIRRQHTVVALHPGGSLDLATPDGTATLQARRVILATGVRETPRSARFIGGDRPQGVINTGALQAFTYLEKQRPFARPVIIGSELVAFSALLTCRKAGMQPVAMVEANDRVTAWSPYALAPRLFGVPLLLETELIEICGSGQVGRVRLRRDNTEVLLDCDGVILTGRFVPAAELVRSSHLALDVGSGGPVVDQHGRCSDAAYFATGNLLRPVETAGWSWREGRRVGAVVAQDLAGDLPAPDRVLSIERGAHVKLTVPQRLALPRLGTGLGDFIQLRASDKAGGMISISCGDRVIWRGWRNTLPERRILIPLADLALPEGADSIRVSIED